MKNLISCLLLIALLGCGGNRTESNRVKALAQQIADATQRNDYASVIDLSYDPIVEGMGGREQAIKKIEKSLAKSKQLGFEILSTKIGVPGEFHVEGANTFVVVPMTVEMTAPYAKSVTETFILGISSDGGKTWKFINGASIPKEGDPDDFLPKRPQKLVLPEIIES